MTQHCNCNRTIMTSVNFPVVVDDYKTTTTTTYELVLPTYLPTDIVLHMHTAATVLSNVLSIRTIYRLGVGSCSFSCVYFLTGS